MLIFLVVALLGFSLGQNIQVKVKEPHILSSIFPNGFSARIIMWGKQSTFHNLEMGLRVADPEDGCETYNFNHPRHDTAFLVTGLTSCPLTNLVHNAQAHGAKAIFVVNNKDTEVDKVIVPDHMPGVSIHVFLLSKQTGDILINIAKQAREEDKNWHIRSRIEIDFMSFVQKTKKVSLEMTFSPDQPTGTKLLADIAESPFVQDLGKNLEIRLNYAMMRCDKCKKDGFKTPKSNCLSGGKYCWTSETDKSMGGEVVLVQSLKHICTDIVLGDGSKTKELYDYYWLFHKNCGLSIDQTCTNSILKTLGIKDDVFKCVTSSFYKNFNRAEHNFEMKHPNIFLQENSLLHLEKEKFNKIEHYAHFPLIKVNEVIYYGQINYGSVFGYICNHINSDLAGCGPLMTTSEIQISRNSRLFENTVIALIVLLVIVGIVVCRTTLKRKFESELSYKIDKSVNEFLQKTGTEL